MGTPSRPGDRQPASDARLEPGAAQPRPPREGAVAEPGDGAGRVALKGHQDHDQAEGEAEGAVEEGQEPGMVVDGGRCEDVRWGKRAVAWPITHRISGIPLRSSGPSPRTAPASGPCRDRRK